MMETLKGKNIIDRMNQLMNYGKTKPKVEEGRNWASLEYSIQAPNGKTYGILREQHKFYIKESKTENPNVKDFEFIGGNINGSKRYYTNYSHALNYLNLMLAEMNKKNPKSKGINLLECEYKPKPMEEEKEVDEKTVLKLPKEQPDKPAPTPAEPDESSQPKGDDGLDLGDDELDLGDEDTEDGGDDLNLDDLDGDEDMGDEEGTSGGGESEKEIQKLTGKLGQKMRELDQSDPDLTKYVMNSVISALDLQDLEDKDKKQIMKKIKKKISGEGEFDDEGKDTSLDLDLGSDGEDEKPSKGGMNFPKKDQEGELSEISTGLANKADLNSQNKPNETEIQESDAPYGEKKEPQNVKGKSAPFNKIPTKLKTESKINKTIRKYFELTPEEKTQESDKFLSESINKVMLLKEGKSKCKTVEQEIALTKVMDYDKNFAIKTMKESLVLETSHKLNLGGKEYKKLIMIETTGKVSGILKDIETKNARQYRIKNKNDYLNFIRLGK